MTERAAPAMQICLRSMLSSLQRTNFRLWPYRKHEEGKNSSPQTVSFRSPQEQVPKGKEDASWLSVDQINIIRSSLDRFNDLDFTFCEDEFLWTRIIRVD